MNNTKPAIWAPGDWNAFFGFGTNILVNLLTLSGLLRFVLKMPDQLVFGRILPATGMMLFLSTLYYAWLAYGLAKRTGRSDVCALPSGTSVPHMFVVTFVIMLPIAARTGDPVKGWEAGLTWVFIQSFVLMAGGFVAPIIRKITPRAALLGTLAGVSIAFISMRPAQDMFSTPLIGITCFAIILASWFGGVRYFGGIPAGLVAIAVGCIIAWGSTLFGMNMGGMSVAGFSQAFSNFGFSFPVPAVDHVFAGFQFLGVILVTAIPFGIYDLVEAMDNVESAAVAGDSFPTTRVLTADGISQLDRLPDGQSIHQRGLHRAPRLESDGWQDWLLGGNRRDGDHLIVVRYYLRDDGVNSRSGNFSNPPLYRHADWSAGFSRKSEITCPGYHSRADAASSRVGQAPDRQFSGGGGNQRSCNRIG